MHKFQHLVPWRKLIASEQNRLKELVMFNPNGSEAREERKQNL